MKQLIKNTILALVTGSLLFSTSCTDLDEEIYGQYAAESISSEEQITAMMGPVYMYLRWTYWGWNSIFDLYEESSDLIVTPKRPQGWGTLYVNMHKHNYTAYTCNHFATSWYQSYGVVNNVNHLLDMDVIKNNGARATELRGVRALAYYWLFDLFRNVPLFTTSKGLDANYCPEQENPEKLYQWILDELDACKAYYKEANNLKPGYGLFNYYAACMLKAKLYLNYYAYFTNGQNTDGGEYYKKAYDEADDVVKNGGYSLASNYRDPFQYDGSACPEIIYAIKFEKNYVSGNYLANKALHAGSAATFGLKSAPWNGNCAIPQFIDTYDKADTRKADTWLEGQQYDQKGEPIQVTVDGESVPLVYTRAVHSVDDPMAYDLEGCRFWKYEIVAGEYGTSYDDVPYFRLADAMFIKAECLLRLGGYKGETEQTAADLITQVRQRAFRNKPAKAMRTVAQLKGGSVYAYGHDEWKCEGADNWDPAKHIRTNEGGEDIELGGLLDDLAWEFVGEHHRRQDLIRFRMTGKNSNVYNGKSWFCKDAELNAADAHRDVFPIYYEVINANPVLKQNTGYNETE